MKYRQAPLPFQGQKRRFLKDFETALKYHFSDTKIFVDLFGGSGLLSHAAKRAVPTAQVIYNDYDNYSARIANIARTNALIADIREIVKSVEKDAKIGIDVRRKILARIEREERAGMVDYVSLSSNLLFSAKYMTSLATLSKEAFYNNVRQSDYATEGYLAGVDVVRVDYKELFAQWRNVPGVVFLVDPPYLSTDCTTYKSGDCWRLGDYLDVLRVIADASYFYFTSNKSSIVELYEWLEGNAECSNPFAGATKKEIATRLNHTSTYTDIMLYRRR